MEGERSIKAFLHAFLGKQNVTPEYSVRPVGPKHRQRFLCELRVPNYGYTGTKWELYCRLENPKMNSLDTRWSFRNVFTIFWPITVFPRFKYYQRHKNTKLLSFICGTIGWNSARSIFIFQTIAVSKIGSCESANFNGVKPLQLVAIRRARLMLIRTQRRTFSTTWSGKEWWVRLKFHPEPDRILASQLKPGSGLFSREYSRLENSQFLAHLKCSKRFSLKKLNK